MSFDDEAMYLPDGDAFVGTHRCQGGWDPNAQHGGPVQALLARCVERVPTLTPMQVVRLTFDLVRPVPMQRPLGVEHRIRREGKKIQLVEVALLDADVEVARVLALRLRAEDVDPAGELPPLPRHQTPLPDATVAVGREDWGSVPGFLEGIELRRLPQEGKGAAVLWARARVPLVAGEDISPLSRMALAGDFVNLLGVGPDFPFQGYSGINPDVTLQVLRPPEGEWVAMAGTTYLRGDTGIGVSSAEIRDASGPVGHASCSQILQSR